MNGKKKKTSLLIPFIIILAAAAIIAAAVVFFALNRPTEALTLGSIDFEVVSGDTFFSLSTELESKGLIRNDLFMNLMVKILPNVKLKKAYYEIPANSSTISVIKHLTTGIQKLFLVTIPEGCTIGKAGEILEENQICSLKDFRAAANEQSLLTQFNIPADSAEGYLFPDTYKMPRSFPARTVAYDMVDNFFKHLTSISEVKLTTEQLHEKIILASIVEREYKTPEEAPLIASVFINRISINMALQSCATVEYILTERKGKKHPEKIYLQDTKIKDSYNTYVNRGLPPGPICSPGLTALKAVFNPAKTDYLYFVLRGRDAQKHYFSSSFTQHTNAKEFYLKG